MQRLPAIMVVLDICGELLLAVAGTGTGISYFALPAKGAASGRSEAGPAVLAGTSSIVPLFAQGCRLLD